MWCRSTQWKWEHVYELCMRLPSRVSRIWFSSETSMKLVSCAIFTCDISSISFMYVILFYILVLSDFNYRCYREVMWWCCWQSNGLVICRARVRFLALHHCIVALSKLLTPSVIFINENENVEKRENNEFANENENEKMMKTKTKLKQKNRKRLKTKTKKSKTKMPK